MFGLLSDVARGLGSVVGIVVGPIIGVSRDLIATTLGITITMVDEAIRAGCESYEDIRDYHNI